MVLCMQREHLVHLKTKFTDEMEMKTVLNHFLAGQQLTSLRNISNFNNKSDQTTNHSHNNYCEILIRSFHHWLQSAHGCLPKYADVHMHY